jgi:hypothetical protein
VAISTIPDGEAAPNGNRLEARYGFCTASLALVRTHQKESIMAIVASSLILAAAGYSLLYLVLGGGIGGAILIFIVARMMGK